VATRRFAIRYSPWVYWLLAGLFLGRRRSWVDVGEDVVRVRMGWSFDVTIPRASIRSAVELTPRWWWLSIGVHTSFLGDWLVNGSMRGLVDMALDPRPVGRSVWRIRPRRVIVSLEEPRGFLEAIGFEPLSESPAGA
jgi:hypothetical protein